MNYKIQINPFTGEPCAITIIGEGISIPMTEDNTDYQQYLAWLSEDPTNQPLPSDEQL